MPSRPQVFGPSLQAVQETTKGHRIDPILNLGVQKGFSNLAVANAIQTED